MVLFPLAVGEHWALLVAQVKSKEVKRYDSLLVVTEVGYLAADTLLTKLKTTGLEHLEWLPGSCPHRCYTLVQGPLECGIFVAWWMEDERRELLGQGRWCRGWPKPLECRHHIEKVLANVSLPP